MSNEFFQVKSETQRISFRLSEIVAIESPNRPHKPAGWCDHAAAAVYLRNRTDAISLTDAQFSQLKDRLGATTWEQV